MKVRVRTSSLMRWGVTVALAANLVLIAFALIARAEGDPKTKPAKGKTSGEILPERSTPASESVSDPALRLELQGEERLLQEVRDLAAEVRREKERLVAARLEAERVAQAEKDAPPAAAAAAAPTGAAGAPPAAQAAAAPPGDPFARLIAAFENMEPETSAAALLPLYKKDREAALRVLLEVSTRKAGALMDALATISPDTAAAIAVDVHSRSPKVSALNR